ncbi:single-stranded DNA-binding protein [Acinetobacter radioresistens]|uniref:single-stranded DNA-binding protein n=1 Tax=Acinetobacter radioresistens TaxID=40216 RepID=UPI0020054DBF|nr:single-stranded DNA-binding protein [Acinetobacter radioresistens]MCK4085086.1 single-stranded DNA-binding protein [Acinetobacter radioresistens]
MQTLNSMQVLGNIGIKAKTIDFPNGGKKTILSVATNIGYGENQRTIWHTVLLYNKSAEICSELDKGDIIWVSGYMDYRKWEDEKGIQRIAPELHAEKFVIVKGQAVKPSSSEAPAPQTGSYADLNKQEQNKAKDEKSTPPSASPTPKAKPDLTDSTPKDIPY